MLWRFLSMIEAIPPLSSPPARSGMVGMQSNSSMTKQEPQESCSALKVRRLQISGAGSLVTTGGFIVATACSLMLSGCTLLGGGQSNSTPMN